MCHHLVGLVEAFLRTDGDAGQAPGAKLSGQVVDTSGRVVARHGTHQDGCVAADLQHSKS